MKWEYLFLFYSFTQSTWTQINGEKREELNPELTQTIIFNMLGRDGWELATTSVLPQEPEYDHEQEYIFKRGLTNG